jgi:hypothetical protein
MRLYRYCGKKTRNETNLAPSSNKQAPAFHDAKVLGEETEGSGLHLSARGSISLSRGGIAWRGLQGGEGMISEEEVTRALSLGLSMWCEWTTVESARVQMHKYLTEIEGKCRGPLYDLVCAAEIFEADQTGMLDPRCGAVQPITVQQGKDLTAALHKAYIALGESISKWATDTDYPPERRMEYIAEKLGTAIGFLNGLLYRVDPEIIKLIKEVLKRIDP